MMPILRMGTFSAKGSVNPLTADGGPWHRRFPLWNRHHFYLKGDWTLCWITDENFRRPVLTQNKRNSFFTPLRTAAMRNPRFNYLDLLTMLRMTFGRGFSALHGADSVRTAAPPKLSTSTRDM